ncbi:MAG: hypothetical protein J7L39_00015 [Candidatus Aenigmarchaeota archaeon]|nr:hypothetical protein [Candidatus Aenigmarchaeota archaeon]
MNFVKFVIILTVFISSLSLFFIFEKISQIKQKCEKDASLSFCERIRGNNFTLLVIFLFIAGFIFIILFSAYILISGEMV